MPSVQTASFNPYHLPFPSTYTASVEDPTNSPQYKSNLGLDAVEIGIKSLLVGRLVSRTAATSVEISMLKQKEVSTLGLTASTAFKTAGKAGLISGGVSLIRNGYHLAQGEINASRAAGNVSADIVGGAVSGMVAATGASIAVKMAGTSAFGMSTLGLIGGAIGFAVADSLYHVSGLRDRVSHTVTGVVERWFDADAQGGGV